MRFLSLCSGIEAASVAWAPIGWKAAAFAEIEAFPSAVLAHHYPDVPNLGDITKFKEWPDLGTIDLICGGTPCQSFSVAGLRKGLADPRGNLALTFLAIVDRYRPRYVVWENVPGVLSSDGGRDFAAFLGGLGQLGYGWAYRVLDAQHVRVDGFPRAVPQRRRRVFVVGYLGDWRRAAAVLSEPESVLGNTPPRREAGQGAAADVVSSLTASGRGVERAGETRGQDPVVAVGFGGNNTSGPIDVATAVNAHGGPAGRLDFESETFIAFNSREDPEVTWDRSGPLGASSPQAQSIAFDTTQITSKANRSQPKPGDPCHPLAAGAHAPAIAIQAGALRENPASGPDGIGVQSDVAYTVEARAEVQAVAFNPKMGGDPSMGLGVNADGTAYTIDHSGNSNAVAFTCSEQANSFAWERDVWQTLDAQIPNDSSNIQKGVRQGWAVRRLMPIECERLQGFPDGYTAIPYRGKPAADGPRYKALGNSWAVNVARWVGRRIEMIEQIAAEKRRSAA